MEYKRGDIGEQVSHYRYKDERAEKMPIFIKRRTEAIRANELDNKNRYNSSKINDILKMKVKIVILDLYKLEIIKVIKT